MSDQLTAFQLAVGLWDQSGIPSFPVLLAQDEDGKWLKKPLVKWGGVTRDTHPSEFNWGGANAVGVPMGRRSGLFAFDLDEYKPQSAASEWVKKHGLPPTRTHGTTSGGRHLIYQMPPSLSLGNSAPKVHGLDVRGDGGFIVWTDTLGRYSVVDDRAPAALPQPVINLLIELNAGKGRILRDTDVPDPKYVSDTDLLPKLQRLLDDPLRNRDLVNRFRGGTAGLKDKSRSSMDMSVAGLLSWARFSYDEIVTTLLVHFPHGKAGRDGWTDAVEREVCRCAHKAVMQREEKLDPIRQQLETSVSDLRERLSRPKNAEDRA